MCRFYISAERARKASLFKETKGPEGRCEIDFQVSRSLGRSSKTLKSVILRTVLIKSFSKTNKSYYRLDSFFNYNVSEQIDKKLIVSFFQYIEAMENSQRLWK